MIPCEIKKSREGASKAKLLHLTEWSSCRLILSFHKTAPKYWQLPKLRSQSKVHHGGKSCIYIVCLAMTYLLPIHLNTHQQNTTEVSANPFIVSFFSFFFPAYNAANEFYNECRSRLGSAIAHHSASKGTCKPGTSNEAPNSTPPSQPASSATQKNTHGAQKNMLKIIALQARGLRRLQIELYLHSVQK